jgi:hypothetical protein
LTGSRIRIVWDAVDLAILGRLLYVALAFWPARLEEGVGLYCIAPTHAAPYQPLDRYRCFSKL